MEENRLLKFHFASIFQWYNVFLHAIPGTHLNDPSLLEHFWPLGQILGSRHSLISVQKSKLKSDSAVLIHT